MSDLDGCPNCGAPRVEGPECPRCGVIYARAHARAPEPELAIAPARESEGWSATADDERWEKRLRLVTLPLALGLAWLLASVPFSRMLLRVFLSMWVHELGHAVTAWFCGFAAMPGPWLTPVAGSRGVVTPLVVATALAALAFHGHRTERRGPMLAAAILFAIQLVGTLVLPVQTARALFTFGGDGGCFVLGTAAMLSMYAPPESSLRRGWLRFGLVPIGAAAFADALRTWWDAHKDFAAIPFGKNEGVGLSDPSVLVDRYGWSETALVGRYLHLALACGVVLALAYAWGLAHARATAPELD